MPTQNLSKIFRPRSVAVVGASAKAGVRRPHRTGKPAERRISRQNLSRQSETRFAARTARVPVGGRASRSARTWSIIATPAATVPGVVRQCGESGVPGHHHPFGGISRSGAAGEAIEAELAAEAAKFPEMRIVGPNCLGVLGARQPAQRQLRRGDAPAGTHRLHLPERRLCTSMLDWSLAENIGFSYFVSIGNVLDVKVGDLIDYFAEDPTTDSIVLYVESVTEARRFMSAARAFTRTKPIVVYKAGRFAESAQAAASHTGAMAGVDAVYDAAFQRAGMVRVYQAEDMFDCAELLARHRTPPGPRLAIVTNAGGPGVMATDELLERRGELGGARRRDASSSSTTCCRPIGRTAIRSTCWATPGPNGLPKHSTSCCRTETWTRCWPSSLRRR